MNEAMTRLTEDEKWGNPVTDDYWGSVRPRIECGIGGTRVPHQCGRYATWKVGRKKLCHQHAAALSARKEHE